MKRNRYKPVKRYGIVKAIVYTKNRPQRVVYLSSDDEEVAIRISSTEGKPTFADKITEPRPEDILSK